MFPDAARFEVQSLKQVAGFFGVTRDTVADWVKRGMPGSPKRFPLDKIAKWLRAEIYPHHVRPKSGDDSTAHLEREKLKTEIQTRKLKLLQLRGKLVARSAVMVANEEAFSRLKARLEAIPEEVGTSIPPALQQDLVADWKNKVDLALREIADWAVTEVDA